MLSEPQALHSTLPATEKLHHSTTPPIPRLKLGTQGLEVSKLGFGCAGLSGYLNLPVPASDGISIINAAFDRGITFFDTSDSYGPHTNEILLGQALKQLPRDKIQIATKFGVAKFDKNSIEVNGSPEYVRASCEASLRRLGVDYIDLYYQHKMGELKKLVEEGKVRYVGLSEPSVDTLRRGHAVHPVQMEWSIWTREIEEEIVPLCRFHRVDSEDLTIAVNFWWKSNMMSNMLEHMDAYYLRRILNRKDWWTMKWTGSYVAKEHSW